MVWRRGWILSKKVSLSPQGPFEFAVPLAKESQRTGAKRYLCAKHTKCAFLFAVVQLELSEGNRLGQRSRWSRGQRGKHSMTSSKRTFSGFLPAFSVQSTCDQICAPVSPALLPEVKVTPHTNSSIICWSGVLPLPILNLRESWKALKNNLHPKHKRWQMLPYLQKKKKKKSTLAGCQHPCSVPVPEKRQLSGPQWDFLWGLLLTENKTTQETSEFLPITTRGSEDGEVLRRPPVRAHYLLFQCHSIGAGLPQRSSGRSGEGQQKCLWCSQTGGYGKVAATVPPGCYLMLTAGWCYRGCVMCRVSETAVTAVTGAAFRRQAEERCWVALLPSLL